MPAPNEPNACRDHADRLADRLEGLLGAREAAALDAHLESCAECRRALAAERRLHRLLAGLEREPAPAGFAERTLAAILPARPERSRRAAWIPRPQFLLAGAAILVLAVLGLSLIPGLGPNGGPEQLRAGAGEAVIEGGRELSGFLQTAERGLQWVQGFTQPLLLKLGSLQRAERVLAGAMPPGLLGLILLVGLSPLVLVFTVYRLRIKGALSHVLAVPTLR